MTQWEFETTLKLIEKGAPALYETLGNSLNNLVLERNRLDKENSELKSKLSDYQSEVNSIPEEVEEQP